jgi:hypothetical protein
MTSALNFCIGGGYVVGLSYELPDDPTAFHSTERVIIGCNNLVCGTCFAKVRSVAGFSLELPSTVRSHDAYSEEDWAAAGWLHPSGGRTYACRCFSILELGAAPSNQLAEVRGIMWECAGHEPRPHSRTDA